jgi:hypothetical protein
VIVVFDQLDLALTVLELEAAAFVDLMRPELERRELRDRRTGRERTGLAPITTTLNVPVSALAARTKGVASAVAAEYFRNSRRRMESSRGCMRAAGCASVGLFAGVVSPSHVQY